MAADHYRSHVQLHQIAQPIHIAMAVFVNQPVYWIKNVVATKFAWKVNVSIHAHNHSLVE